jgi:hypothetical protein
MVGSFPTKLLHGKYLTLSAWTAVGTLAACTVGLHSSQHTAWLPQCWAGLVCAHGGTALNSSMGPGCVHTVRMSRVAACTQ